MVLYKACHFLLMGQFLTLPLCLWSFYLQRFPTAWLCGWYSGNCFVAFNSVGVQCSGLYGK
jgi:hypothetical protein